MSLFPSPDSCDCPDCCHCPDCCDCPDCCPKCCKNCCDENRCCCGLCPNPCPSCPSCCDCCCGGSKCCCGLCDKCCNCKDKKCCCAPCPTCGCCGNIYNYNIEIFYPNGLLKYRIYNNSICNNCGCKCSRRKSGLDLTVSDINKNPITTIHGRNNQNFGKFFDDSYSYEINFPLDAEPDIKLTILHGVYALDALCIY